MFHLHVLSAACFHSIPADRRHDRETDFSSGNQTQTKLAHLVLFVDAGLRINHLCTGLNDKKIDENINLVISLSIYLLPTRPLPVVLLVVIPRLLHFY